MPEGGSSPAEPGTARPRGAIVLGATGVVGHFLLPRLSAAGWRVHAISRRPVLSAAPPGVRWHAYDVGQGLAGVDTDGASVVFHAAPLSLLPPLVPELAARGVTRAVAFGSTSRFTKQDAPSAASRATARWLAEAEDALAAACTRQGIAWTVFRPTLIYGAGVDRNVSSVARLARRWGVFPLAGDARGLRQPVYGDDLALACLQALDEPGTFGRAYNLVGGATLSYREMVERVFHALGRRPRLPRVPLPLLRAALSLASRLPRLRRLGPDMADRMNADQCFDSAEAARDFGYAPRPFDATLVVQGIGGV
jgi:nucleoside-diphosphate-sugar epimerase